MDIRLRAFWGDFDAGAVFSAAYCPRYKWKEGVISLFRSGSSTGPSSRVAAPRRSVTWSNLNEESGGPAASADLGTPENMPYVERP
jgi:hypothetical protein